MELKEILTKNRIEKLADEYAGVELTRGNVPKDGKYDVEPCVGNKKVYVGRFNTLEDAIYERDMFLEAGCDFDTYFTATDDTTDEGERFLQGKLSTRVVFETGPRNDIGIYNHCIRRGY